MWLKGLSKDDTLYHMIGDWSRLNDIAIMFVTKRRFKQKKGTEHYPETDSYKHLGSHQQERIAYKAC